MGTVKPLIFWLLVALVSITVIAVSVGGAVAAAHNTNTNSTAKQMPSRDCPESGGTTFTSKYTIPPSGGLVGSGTIVQRFVKQCGRGGNAKATVLVTALVPTFDACIELCASVNYWKKLDKRRSCTLA